ncbi:MAG: GNAT family N-acetyltransferase [Planctomycetaceae bacterium]|nr:GNAT family N-acetyltransferase [Planctomycetaceae bacterium]
MSFKVDILTWDSEFFGFPVAKIAVPPEFSRDDLKSVLDGNASEFSLIYVFQNGIGPDEISGLAQPCLCFDRKVVFRKSLSSIRPAEKPPNVGEYRGTICSSELEQLAYLSGSYSRFKKDTRLEPFFEKLYQLWIQRSISGEIADVVLVDADEDMTRGVVTVKKLPHSEGMIGLVAVGQNFQRRGIASNLLTACDIWCLEHGLSSLSVATQQENKPACQTYEKNGYVLEEIHSIYHYWTKPLSTPRNRV